MSKKKVSTKAQRRQQKKDQIVSQPQSQTSKALIVPGILAAIVVAVGVWLVMGLLPGGNAPQPSSIATAPVASTPSSATQVQYATALFSDGKARHYEHRATDKITVRYFILKSSDGVIRAAFDACDVCWPAGKGYYQEGDHMVCRNCGRRFASVLVNEVQGGCNPAPLKRAIQGDQLVIELKDLLEGQRYFNFSEKA